MAYSGKQTCFTLWMVVQRFLTRFQPIQLPPHATGGSSLCTHTYSPIGMLSFISSDTYKQNSRRLQTHRKAAWPVGWVPVGYFSSGLCGSCPASWSVSSFWYGRTDSAHRKHLRWKPVPYRNSWRGWAFDACISKEPSGSGHGLHPNTGLVGPGNSSLRMRE